MGLNHIKGLNRMLKGKNLAMKILAAFIVFWLFSLVLNVLNIQTEGFKVGGGFGGNMLVYFYMNGCPHCDKFNPIWEEFIRSDKAKTINHSKVSAEEMNEEEKFGVRHSSKKIICEYIFCFLLSPNVIISFGFQEKSLFFFSPQT